MIEVDGRPTPEELPADVFVMNVGSRYFEALGARVLRGRGLTDDDGHAGSEAAVVNERFAALFFGAEDALGRRIRIRARDDSMSPWLTIVGIGSNVRVGDIRKRDWAPVVHLPYRMDAGPSFGLQILTEGAPHTFVPQLRAVVRALDRDLPVHHARSMAAVLAEGRWWFFVLSGTLGVFALFAVVLAAVGIYAVAACAVAQRTREIGIRIALGAQAHRTVRTALGRVLAYVGVGLLLWTGRRRGRRPGDREPADSGPARRSADPGAGAAAVRCTGRRGVRGVPCAGPSRSIRPMCSVSSNTQRAPSRGARCSARQPAGGELDMPVRPRDGSSLHQVRPRWGMQQALLAACCGVAAVSVGAINAPEEDAEVRALVVEAVERMNDELQTVAGRYRHG